MKNTDLRAALCLFLAAGLVALLPACAGKKRASDDNLSRIGDGTVVDDARLRPGDLLEVRIGGVPIEEINQVMGTYIIDGEGFINMPHIGRVRAAGLTQSEIQQTVENAYNDKKVYDNPSITVLVPLAARFVYVGGDVRVPQRLPFSSDLTVLGAINSAGGFTEYANQGRVKLLRDGQVYTVNVKRVRKDPSQDVLLKPGDKIEVPQSFF